MDINQAQQVMLRTHMTALRHETRASAMYLESGPGIGKSDGTFQYAAKLARELNEPVGIVQFMLATICSVDVRGFLMPVRREGTSVLDTIFSIPPWFPTKQTIWAVEPDGTWHRPGAWTGSVPRVGVLFLDEFAQAEDEVKKPAAEILLHGRVGICELPPGWRAVAAGNRMSDRSGVMRELMFIVNRRCKLAIDASLPAWIDWANAQPPHSRPHYLTMSFAQKNPDIVFKDKIPDGADPFCTPRTLCLLDRDLMALRSAEDEARNRVPTDGLAREVAAGWIGGPSAAQYFTHLKYADELPDIHDVVRTPDRARLPGERSAQMVCGYMLAHHVTEKTAGPIMRYIRRINVEMQVLFVRAVRAQGEDFVKAICATPEFTSWLMEHKALLIAAST